MSSGFTWGDVRNIRTSKTGNDCARVCDVSTVDEISWGALSARRSALCVDDVETAGSLTGILGTSWGSVRTVRVGDRNSTRRTLRGRAGIFVVLQSVDELLDLR